MSEVKDLAIIDVKEIATTMQNAGEVLTKNEALVNSALKGGQELLDTIEAEGMSDELDAAANDWQIKVKKAVEITNTRRTPITQVIAKMAKFFTELEGKLDTKKAGTVAFQIQSKRNEHASDKAKKAKADADAIKLQQDSSAEKINLTSEITTQIKAIYNDKLFAFKKFVTDTYNKLNLGNVDEIKKKVYETKEVYPLEAWNSITPTVFAKYLKKDEVDTLVSELRDKLYDECAANFRENMEAHKQKTLDQFSSRINELQAIAKASEGEKQRLEEEANNRKKAAEKQESDGAEEKRKSDAKKIEDDKKIATAGNLFDSTSQLQQLKDTTSNVKEGVKINVLNTDGLAAIFMFYFEKEGRGLSVDVLSKKTLLQMTAFAEKKALKDNELILSDHLEYMDEYKAKVTK